MTPKCPSPETLLAAAEERLPAAQAAAWSAHLETCAACREAVAHLRGLQTSLGVLGEADRAAAPALAWAALAERIERPRFADRLPLGALAAWRQSNELLRPAVAGPAVATLAGLALGIYLAGTSQGGTSRTLAAEPFVVSNLVEDGARGLAAAYFGDAESESEALGSSESARGSGAVEPPVASSSDQGTEANPTAIGAPAAGDSQGVQP